MTQAQLDAIIKKFTDLKECSPFYAKKFEEIGRAHV